MCLLILPPPHVYTGMKSRTLCEYAVHPELYPALLSSSLPQVLPYSDPVSSRPLQREVLCSPGLPVMNRRVQAVISGKLSRDELVRIMPLCLARRLCAQARHLPESLPVAIATMTNLHGAPLGQALQHLAS